MRRLKGPEELIEPAEFILSLLGVGHVTATFKYSKEDNDSSECLINIDGSFIITIQKGLDVEESIIRHLGHELVHLKQFKRDELFFDGTYVIWKNEKHNLSDNLSDEYFLSPWEMEARALEDWILHRWEESK